MTGKIPKIPTFGRKNMLLLLVATIFYRTTHAAYVISVYGDVYKDAEFFNRTYPWIIDNIGGEISVDYFMMGSGRYSVPQMCALKELRMNTYLQAQYLKCEALGNPSTHCLCETGIDPKKFKQCVATGGSLASVASEKFTQLGIDTTPIVELGPKSTVFGVEDTWFLKKICTIFGDNLPRGCVKPFACNQSDSFQNKNALAQFDRDCPKEFPITCGNEEEYINSTPWPTTDFYHYYD